MLSWHSGCYCVSWTFPHLLFLSAAASWSRVSFKNVVRLKRLFCSSGNKTSVLSADSRTSSSRLKKGTYTQEWKDCLIPPEFIQAKTVFWFIYLKNGFCSLLIHFDVWPYKMMRAWHKKHVFTGDILSVFFFFFFFYLSVLLIQPKITNHIASGSFAIYILYTLGPYTLGSSK